MLRNRILRVGEVSKDPPVFVTKGGMIGNHPVTDSTGFLAGDVVIGFVSCGEDDNDVAFNPSERPTMTVNGVEMTQLEVTVNAGISPYYEIYQKAGYYVIPSNTSSITIDTVSDTGNVLTDEYIFYVVFRGAGTPTSVEETAYFLSPGGTETYTVPVTKNGILFIYATAAEPYSPTLGIRPRIPSLSSSDFPNSQTATSIGGFMGFNVRYRSDTSGGTFTFDASYTTKDGPEVWGYLVAVAIPPV